MSENVWQHVKKRAKEEPWVVLGAGLTTAALLGAALSLRKGDRKRTQTFFRLRVGLQFGTVIAMLAGSILMTNKRQVATAATEAAAVVVVDDKK